MKISELTPTQLRHAADLKEQIENLQNHLNQLEGNTSPQVAVAAKPARKKISAAGIARIRAVQKARWAKITSAAQPAPTPVSKKKGMISAAGIARIKAAQKARWAKIKAGAKPAAKPAPKSAAKKKGAISAAGIARIKAAQKARWAKFRAQQLAKK